MKKNVLISLVGFSFFNNHNQSIKVGDKITLRKVDNEVDDEAIAVVKGGHNIAYVANSVSNIPKGCFSAGRLYDKFTNEIDAKVILIDGAVHLVIAEVELGV